MNSTKTHSYHHHPGVSQRGARRRLILYRRGSSTPEILLRMMVSFGTMGFTIGISSLRWHCALNGLLIGAVFGLIKGLASLVMGFPLLLPILSMMVFGLFIELVTSTGFKARVSSSPVVA